MSTNKHIFSLRLTTEAFDQIRILAENKHLSIGDYIEYILICHLEEIKLKQGKLYTIAEN